jgi:hypothetical protein
MSGKLYHNIESSTWYVGYDAILSLLYDATKKCSIIMNEIFYVITTVKNTIFAFLHIHSMSIFIVNECYVFA